MGQKIDLMGQRFGRWLVVGEVKEKKFRCFQWAVRCDCGKHGIVMGTTLRSGNTKSCGCLRDEVASQSCTSRTVHGHRPRGGQTREYNTWHNMKQRCSNPNRDNYKYYGGRGVTV